MHPVFHIYLLKKCGGDPTPVVPLENVAVKDSHSYADVSVKIIDYHVRRLRKKEGASLKVFWTSQYVDGATWEAEVVLKTKHPHLFFPIPL